MAKRKLNGQSANIESPAKKSKNFPITSNAVPAEVIQKFRPGLFDSQEKKVQKKEYEGSSPYKHGVLHRLVEDRLLKEVLCEVQTKIHFTPKETDIYRIHQSGDLANLDGLDDSALKELPALLELRNALYSPVFRKYLADITGSGPLSGKKTDMAINIYTPGCHLLCHDDVIGSRRVSYILYLTKVWKKGWGGALRLYPTATWKNSEGLPVQVPNPDPAAGKSIPPAWNQLSFFAVQPGESYHDVEEVYSKQASEDSDPDEERVRVAISGWFHIPQEGEDGYKPGLEERVAAKSSLAQLQSKAEDFDLPQTYPMPYFEDRSSNPGLKFLSSERQDMLKGQGFNLDSRYGNIPAPAEDLTPNILTEDECDFLLKYMSPRFLTPEYVSEMREEFEEISAIRMDGFLSDKFANILKGAIENEPQALPNDSKEIEKESIWNVARPPHKHRYLYLTPTTPDPNKQNLLAVEPRESSPVRTLLVELFPSMAFRKWVRLATGLVLRDHDVKARRFRRGNDYQLATAYNDEEPRLEITLGITPSGYWESPEQEDGEEDADEDIPEVAEVNNGGDEVYMAGDDTGQEAAGDGSDLSSGSSESEASDATSATDDDYHLSQAQTMNPSKRKEKPPAKRKAGKKQTLDPAVYQSASDGAEDDGVLFNMPAGWNRLSLVLRDKGTLKFVKYVSANAMADRWDVTGDYRIDWAKTDAEEIDA